MFCVSRFVDTDSKIFGNVFSDVHIHAGAEAHL